MKKLACCSATRINIWPEVAVLSVSNRLKYKNPKVCLKIPGIYFFPGVLYDMIHSLWTMVYEVHHMNWLTFVSARILLSFFFNDHRSDLSESFLTFSFGQSPRIDSLKNAGDLFKISVYDFSDTPDFSDPASESVCHQGNLSDILRSQSAWKFKKQSKMNYFWNLLHKQNVEFMSNPMQ